MTKLTTITTYWNRPQILATWLRALVGATLPGIEHLVYVVGEEVPMWAREIAFSASSPVIFLQYGLDKAGDLSIGHYHNLGAAAAAGEWIMKLDVDAIPHNEYFVHLLNLLEAATPREWFNGGMIYMHRGATQRFLAEELMPLKAETYDYIIANRRQLAMGPAPAASNFICRRNTYVELGGCDERFRGYGWEDYQQLYMLERDFLQADPLPGKVDLTNVTQRCRDEISRRKAQELFERDSALCLLHCWHARGRMDPQKINENRRVLINHIESYDRK